jgi:hypothetical protein
MQDEPWDDILASVAGGEVSGKKRVSTEKLLGLDCLNIPPERLHFGVVTLSRFH